MYERLLGAEYAQGLTAAGYFERFALHGDNYGIKHDRKRMYRLEVGR